MAQQLASFVRRAWYSAGWSHELRRKPLGRKLLGEHVVLFRDEAGRARAARATCPHRGANLARGRVVDGAIACPFHGWRFDGDGVCVRVPSQPANMKIPKLARLRTYPLREQQGILWIWMADGVEPDREPPRYDFLEEDAGFSRIMDRPRLGAAPFVTVVENAIDNTHPPFIHARSLPGEPEIVENQVITIEPDGRGYHGVFDLSSEWKEEKKGHQGAFDLLRPFMRLSERDRSQSYFRFDLGGVVFFYDVFASGHRHVGLACITPADETHTWFFGEMVRSYWRSRIVDQALRLWGAWLNWEDVEECARLLVADRPGGIEQPVSVVADAPALAFRQVYANALREESGAMGEVAAVA